LLADEPTGALDSGTGREVLQLFQTLNSLGRTIIIITHDLQVAARSRRIVRIEDGRLYADGGESPSPAPAPWKTDSLEENILRAAPPPEGGP
jgi:ABC-type lipoprotein export system ATPase subunit